VGSYFQDFLRVPLGEPLLAGGYRAWIATSADQLAAAFGLRSRVFAEEGFVDSTASSGLQDDFDDVSAHIAVSMAEEVIGTTRLVLPSPRGYLTERLFDFEVPAIDRSRLAEFGRLAIDRRHRGGQRLPMLLLLTMVYRCMRQNHIEWVYAYLPPKLAASYAAIGCVSHPLTIHSPRPETIQRRLSMRGYFEHQDVQPVLFQLTEMLREIHAR
jgi:N-acyl-L-homoserine lactone synthetase